MTKHHPTNNWKWNDQAEMGFVEWLSDLHGPYSFRSEWFYGDCGIEDPKTREEAMHAWLHVAYVAGHELGRGGGKDVQA